MSVSVVTYNQDTRVNCNSTSYILMVTRVTYMNDCKSIYR